MGYLAKLIIPKMKKNKFGSMVHISSVDALSGDAINLKMLMELLKLQ